MQVSIEGICVFLFLDVRFSFEIVHWKLRFENRAISICQQNGQSGDTMLGFWGV